MQSTHTNAEARTAKASRNHWETYNIAREIGKFADKLGLECLSTGGNCDFIVKSLSEDNEVMAVLSAVGQDSPDTLSEPCFVGIKLDDQWMKSVEIKFKSAREAMRFMAKLSEVMPINIGDLIAN